MLNILGASWANFVEAIVVPLSHAGYAGYAGYFRHPRSKVSALCGFWISFKMLGNSHDENDLIRIQIANHGLMLVNRLNATCNRNPELPLKSTSTSAQVAIECHGARKSGPWTLDFLKTLEKPSKCVRCVSTPSIVGSLPGSNALQKNLSPFF